MKLIAKYNRVNIPIIIITLVISSIAFYFMIRYVLVHQLDKDLQIEKEEIIHYVNEKGTLPEATKYKDQQIEFYPAVDNHFKTKYFTEDDYDHPEGEIKSFRKLEFPVSANGINYKAVVKKSMQETEDIIQMILLIVLVVIVFLLLVLFVANRFLLAKLWKPFNQTLDQLKQFNLSSKNKITLGDTDINEFKELNETALIMTQKVMNDYGALKKFTENASHEIQTPLAIIKNKIEILSQSENLERSQLHLIQTINDAATRLSKLNQSLLLLTKIENNQFDSNTSVDISLIVNRCIENYEELAGIKGIIIEKNIQDHIFLKVNDSLAEILISNIVLNAIRHNDQNGKIQIELNPKQLEARNTGNEPQVNTTILFERFRKDTASNDSIGLGLSIVKTICDTYGFEIIYRYSEGWHLIKIAFGNQ
ncbi:MAG: HAMP domain-containing histidine kinase [Bacteroidetes bacterium]|nr:HAMP domain-containing histidine kinase [Bacteroidota bacterium]